MVYLLRCQNKTTVADEVDVTVTAQHKDWPNIRTCSQYILDWAKVCQKLTDQLFQPNQDLVQENALLLTSCGMLYLDFIDACQNDYSKCIEKCILLFAIMLQGAKFRNYTGETLYMMACF